MRSSGKRAIHRRTILSNHVDDFSLCFKTFSVEDLDRKICEIESLKDPSFDIPAFVVRLIRTSTADLSLILKAGFWKLLSGLYGAMIPIEMVKDRR